MNAVDVLALSSASATVWSHATNSRAELAAALRPCADGGVDMIEADILMGTTTSGEADGALRPIMAHPPNSSSDLSFDEFIDSVFAYNSSQVTIGCKLDFKDPAVVEPCLAALAERLQTRPDIGIPVWLNADIWSGPGGGPPKFDAVHFLRVSQEMMALQPAVQWALSPGWTTNPAAVADDETMSYTAQHTQDAIDCLKQCNCSGVPVTFPVQCTFACRGDAHLIDLIAHEPLWSLTLWGQIDSEATQAWVQGKAAGGDTFIDTKDLVAGTASNATE
jgi:hypothetical protein